MACNIPVFILNENGGASGPSMAFQETSSLSRNAPESGEEERRRTGILLCCNKISVILRSPLGYYDRGITTSPRKGSPRPRRPHYHPWGGYPTGPHLRTPQPVPTLRIPARKIRTAAEPEECFLDRRGVCALPPLRPRTRFPSSTNYRIVSFTRA